MVTDHVTCIQEIMSTAIPHESEGSSETPKMSASSYPSISSSAASVSSLSWSSDNTSFQSSGWATSSNLNGTDSWADILTTAAAPTHLPYSVKVVVGVLVSCVILITLIGNLLVISSFCRYRQLRNYTQYFILSLAVSDLLVGCVDMPLYALVFILGFWPFGEIFCDIFVFCDHAFSHFSVISAVVISLDRFVALTKPFFHRRSWRTTRNAALLISLTYLIPTTIWLPLTVLWPVFAGGRNVQTNTCVPQYVESLAISITAPVLFFWLPVSIVIVLYYHVYKKIGKTLVTMKERNAQQMRELKPTAHRCDEETSGRGLSIISTTTGGTTMQPGPVLEGASELGFSVDVLLQKQKSGLEKRSVEGVVNAGYTPARDGNRVQNVTSGKRTLRQESTANGSGHDDKDQDSAMPSAEPINHAPGLNSSSVDLAEPSQVQATGTPENPHYSSVAARTNNDQNELLQPPKERPSLDSRWRVVEKRARLENARATRMLGCIIAAMIIAWLPWAIVVMVINLCKDCLPELLYAVSVFLGYMNSTLNPFCYAIADRRFRRAFKEILRRPCKRGSSPDLHSTNHSSHYSERPMK